MEQGNLSKSAIRIKIKQISNAISKEQKVIESNNVFAKIESMKEFQQAFTILIYWSLPDELSTQEFIYRWKDDKKIVLPSVKGNCLEIKMFENEEDTFLGKFGILEPKTSEIYTGDIDLVIVPGVAFDKQRNRLGRGRGYYDRFLKGKNILKWGVCFHFQLLENIPVNDEDIMMDKIITSETII